MASNDNDTFGAMAEGVEHVSLLISRYALFEYRYLHRGLWASDLGFTAQSQSRKRSLHTTQDHQACAADQLARALVRLYTAILMYLSQAMKYYGRSAGRESSQH